MQFSGAFWATLQRFQMSSHAIDQLLSREETTLADVLSDDMVVQETRSQNPKLIEFFNLDRILELFEYITVFPEDSEDKKRTQNQPFIACEILSEGSQIHDKIADNPELMQKLFEFLDQPNPHLTLIGYFSKSVLALITRSPEKSLIYMAQNGVNHKLISHIYSKSIADIITKILTIDVAQSEIILAGQKEILVALLGMLVKGSEYQTFYSAIILSDILNKAMEINSWRELVDVIVNEESLKGIYECLVSEENFRATAAAGVLKTLFMVCVRVNLYFYYERLRHLDLLIEFLPRIKARLENSPESSSRNTMQEDFTPLGESRLRIIELISTAMKQDNEGLFCAISDSSILPLICSLFFRYPWHSILHNIFDSILQSTLLYKNEALISSLLITSSFISNLIQACQQSAAHRPGYLGHLHKFANNLKSCENSTIQTYLQGQTDWESFIINYLEARNANDTKQLGDINKKEDSSSSSFEESSGGDMNMFSSYGHQNKDTENKKEAEEIVEENTADKDESVVKEIVKDEYGSKEVVDEKKGEFVDITLEAIEKVVIEEVRREEGSPTKMEIDVGEAEGKSNQRRNSRENRVSPRNENLGIRRNSLSPRLEPEFNCSIYWKVQLIVDEMDLEPL